MTQLRRLAAILPVVIAACSLPSGTGLAQQSAEPPVVAQNVEAGVFPGAIGHGAASRGGHGGRIIAVTTLADNGAGSLRACIEETGPRICVFRVNGVIRFSARPPYITNPYITIAGQTAPGGGITLAHSGGAEGRTPLVIKGTHDVIVRHIRIRPDISGNEQGSEDGVTIENSERVILDHLSVSWARDELVNGFADNDAITISNSIFAAGVPRHDKCALLASDPDGPQNLSFIGNICAHNGDRNPDINFPPESCVEVVNNLFYNAQSEFAEIWESEGGSPISLVGNVFLAGPDTHGAAIGIVRAGIAATGDGEAYLWDNGFEGDFTHIAPEVADILVDTPPCPLTVTPRPSAGLLAHLRGSAGTWPHDAFDSQLMQEIDGRGGRIGRAPSPLVQADAVAPYADADADGMDDAWETQHGNDPASIDPWADVDGNGFADFEDFLSAREATIQSGAAHN
ncbi:hypothetical protein CP97_06085 [Aurantiacibacter atlanticus]|uniref:Pectate lyase n=1 Tax=Aurantiacibacter atlanticus TaxID=1648404 RepID=A0A0H4W150_9SPHN|nr:pectate lyase [Aurantiacibacter atlanticus]AKQ43218.2 hypothetical protein CP97_06085 [Aurantiacibacter atlanticus]MDF1833358.1 pectate lyase [Alteraurantiacibacter sp. bin_em_oilr2.035]